MVLARCVDRKVETPVLFPSRKSVSGLEPHISVCPGIIPFFHQCCWNECMNPISPMIYIAFVIASRHFWTLRVYISLCHFQMPLDFSSLLMLFSHSKLILWALDTSVRENFLCMCWRTNSKVVLRDTVKHILKQIEVRGLTGISYHQSGKQYMYANCENRARLGLLSLRKYHIIRKKQSTPLNWINFKSSHRYWR